MQNNLIEILVNFTFIISEIHEICIKTHAYKITMITLILVLYKFSALTHIFTKKLVRFIKRHAPKPNYNTFLHRPQTSIN